MKNFDFKNVFNIFKLNFYTSRKVVFGWSLSIMGIMFLYMILFSSIQDMATMKFEAMPEQLLQFVGMSDMSDLSDFTTYFGMIYTLVLTAMAIFASTFSAGLITKEEKTKSIEFLNSLSVSRAEIYVAKYITATISIGIILTLAVITTIICGLINGGDSFDLFDIISTAKITSFSALFFSGIAFLIAGASSKFGTGGIVSGVVLSSYMIGYLGELLGENGEFLLNLSPFISFSVKNILEAGSELYIVLAIYIVVYIASLVVGGYLYNKRDLRI